MLLDLVSTDNYLLINIKLAEIVGLQQAVYISELLNINEKAERKKCIDEDGFFSVDRAYVLSKTTIQRDVQQKLDIDLASIGLIIVHPENRNKLKLDTELLVSMVSSTTKEERDLKKQVLSRMNEAGGTKKKITKKEAEIDVMKSYIETSNPELYCAYCEWIDSVYSKLGWMSKRAVMHAQELVDTTSNRNLDVALGIIDIATVNGYKDMVWAVKAYNERAVSSATKSFSSVPQARASKLSDEVF